MTREMRSLGKDVAHVVAERLGLEIVHNELVEDDLARRMHLSGSEVHRFLEGEEHLMERWKIDRRRLSSLRTDGAARRGEDATAWH